MKYLLASLGVRAIDADAASLDDVKTVALVACDEQHMARAHVARDAPFRQPENGTLFKLGKKRDVAQ